MKIKSKLPRRVIIKVGTSTLTDSGGRIDQNYIRSLVEQISSLVNSGVQCVLVSSGAIRAGSEKLHFNGKPRTIPEKQAAAAVGQGLLMNTYSVIFSEAEIAAAQVLLTRDDFTNRTRYLNARNTLNTLLTYKCVPVINENDTVAIDEIKFGDNDTLAAMVASTINADLLILLSDVPGLYDRDPSEDGCELIPVVEKITPEIRAIAGDTNGISGTGGMRTKIDAAQIATRSGITMVIADGRQPGVIGAVAKGEPVGTRFLANDSKLSSRKKWIAFSTPIKGTLTVNEGARKMIIERGKSLLPAGIVGVAGTFKAGALVAVTDESGRRFARGFANYSAGDIHQIKGLHTDMVEAVLGHKDFDEVIHRDNLVLGI